MTRQPLTVDATGEPDVDLAAGLGVPLLLALLAADESRRPSLRIVPRQNESTKENLDGRQS